MLSLITRKFKNTSRVLGILLLIMLAQPVWAAGPPESGIFSNTLAVTFIILMILLLIIIGILAYLLIGTADLRLKKQKTGQSKTATAIAASLLFFLLMCSPSLFAQDAGATTDTAPVNIGGMAPTTFYIMIGVIFLELLIILVLLVNIRFLLKAEKAKLAEPAVQTKEAIEAKRNRLTWWDRFNSLRPVSQESELDLGHDYDGIRELNNRLPPWWIYGFYLTIIFAAIYLYRFHISHTGPSSKEEYETSVAKAEAKINAYLKQKGDNIDENTVTYLSDKADIDAGKELFTKGACGSCHGTDGSGIVFGQPGVGPNLTDDYWLHGGSIKNIFTTIKYGVTGKGMQSWSSTYSAKQMAQIASFVKSIHGAKVEKAKDPQGDLYKEEATTPAVDSLKLLNDSIKAKDNKVAKN